MKGIKIFGLRLPPLWLTKGLPKTILFNYKYFDFKDAIKLPVFISSQVLLKELNGTIKLLDLASMILEFLTGNVREQYGKYLAM